MIAATDISKEHFDEVLNRYDEVIKKLGKTSAVTKKTLVQLDEFRYITAPARYSTAKTEDAEVKPMTVEDLTALVDWKLTHEKRRPKLYEYASSNSPDIVKDATQKGIAHYQKQPSDLPKVIKLLSGPKGVGPAAASLLLSVYDPSNAIFFADEIFHWLCLGGKPQHLQYNIKEYEELALKAHELKKRLGVSCVEIEKVGYVLMKEKEAPDLGGHKPHSSASKAGPKISKATEEEKRKTEEEPTDAAGPRRSKRRKA